MKHDSGFGSSEVMYPSVVGENGASHQMVPAGGYPGPIPSLAIPMPPRGPEILNGPLNQTWLLNCLRRKWLPALFLGSLAAIIVAILLWFAFPLSSQTMAYLQFETEQPSDIFEKGGRVNPKEFEIYQQTQLTLLKSQYVLKAALARREIAQLNAVLAHRPDELAWLSDNLQVSFPGQSEIMMIKYEGEENPEDMIKIVNAVIDAYKNEVVAADRISKAEAHRQMEALHQQLVADLKEKIERKQTLAKELGGAGSPNASAELNMLIRDIGMIDSQIIKAKEQLVNLEVNRELQTRAINSPTALKAAVGAEMDKDPQIQQFQAEMYQYGQQLRMLQASSKRRTPEINRLEQALSRLKQQAEQYQMQLEADLTRQFKNAPNDQMQMIMAEYIMRRRSTEQLLADLQAQRDQKREEIDALGEQNGELAMLDAEVLQLQEIARTMDIKLQGWKVQEKTAAEQVKTIGDGAFNQDKINVFERYAIISVGALAAFCGTCYGIALLEFRRRRLNSPSDVDEGLGIRVLGVLPPVASRKAMAPGSLTAAQLSESIDNVRATLMHDSTSRPRQVVLVASPSSMEGSTTVASHLALSLTRAGRRTLLVDGDLRDPSLHKLFGMPLEDGLCELLRSEIEIADATRPTNTEGLWLMTAGICDMDAIHALATDQLQPIFEKLRAEFDFIVIDGAPILGLSDSLSIGQHVDGAILTVLRDQSGVRNIHQASELLKGLGIRLLGSVVNGMPFKADRRITRIHRTPSSKAKRLPAAEEAET